MRSSSATGEEEVFRDECGILGRGLLQQEQEVRSYFLFLLKKSTSSSSFDQVIENKVKRDSGAQFWPRLRFLVFLDDIFILQGMEGGIFGRSKEGSALRPVTRRRWWQAVDETDGGGSSSWRRGVHVHESQKGRIFFAFFFCNFYF